MIPLKDTVRSRTFPLVTWLIIALNALVFLYELRLSPAGLDQFINTYALVPARVNLFDPASLVPVFTSMFVHGGWFHFLSNMWVLFLFGDNVEDRMGPGWYLIFYLLSGLAAALLQVYVDPAGQIPTLGASGAIAGVLGAYFSLFPTARVLTLIPIFFIPWLIEVPALVFLGFWFVSQLVPGLLSLGSHSAGGIAWWAHIGGFIFGLLIARVLARRRRPQTWYPDQYWPW